MGDSAYNVLGLPDLELVSQHYETRKHQDGYGFKSQKANTRNRCFWTCTIFSVRTKVQNLKPPFYSGKFLKQEDG